MLVGRAGTRAAYALTISRIPKDLAPYARPLDFVTRHWQRDHILALARQALDHAEQEGNDLFWRGRLTKNKDLTLGAGRCLKGDFLKRPSNVRIRVGNYLYANARITGDERIVGDCL
jgi:hypothetical protein